MTSSEPQSDLPPIIQYWHSEEIPDYIGERLETFRECNPDMRHLVFSERTAGDLIAECFGERHLNAFQVCAVPAMQADYFRYCGVHALGGVYADADFSSDRPLRPLLDEGEGQLFEQPNGPVLNGLFGFRSPGHPFLAMAVEIATSNVENRISDSVALTTGPAIFTGLVRLHREGSFELLRESTEPNWKPLVETCWQPLVDAFTRAVENHGPMANALHGVRISPRAEMLTWVKRPGRRLPYKYDDDYWGNWQGTIFRATDSGESR